MNMLTASLHRSKRITSESIMVLSKWEHHANIVPWQILAEQTWAQIKRVDVDEFGIIDYAQLEGIVTEWWVTLVAVQSCSNATWAVNDLVKVRLLLWDEVLLVVDASQSTPHYAISLETVKPDFLFWTGHKIGAYTGCGVMIGKKSRLDALQPGWWGWWAIERVSIQWHTYQWSPDKFEPGTPNLIWAVSIAAAINYIESTWWFDAIQIHEKKLIEYCLEETKKLEKYGLMMVWPHDASKRIGVFGFASSTHNLHQIWQKLAQENICVRTWGQCAHPLHNHLGNEGTLRMSVWITNGIDDCEKFFGVLDNLLQ
jgi:cysteine desulfurase/selenocysteine lyase